ncbi:MAG: 6-bladed beta-propeller [Acidobacteriota bacterium]|nr:6-bladed beta-propeller [Acidobacteriota bacterium]
MVGGFGDQDLKNPCGIAIDEENRFIYVADVDLDQVLVYDADSYKLLRRLGVTGKNHTSTVIGEFSKPTNVAVDKDGNLYVSDTLNDRVEVFDADGNFIRTWGKNGDGAGDFARPKGIAIDADGHVWVADAMLNRLQVFTPEGRLLMAAGSFGIWPGQFEAITGLTIDKKNRIFTAEQLLGRVQMFRYFTNDEAKAEIARREDEAKKRAVERDAQKKAGSGMKLPDAPPVPQAAAPQATK